MTVTLKARALTAVDFAPYGEVIELDHAGAENAWAGDLIDIAVGDGGRAKLSVVHCRQPVALPLAPPLLECHPLGSQAFIPRDRARFVVVVGLPGAVPDLDGLAAFITSGAQGINYRPGVWHIPFSCLDQGTTLVLDRAGPGDNTVIVHLEPEALVIA